jgi:3-oxo-5,6-didehydrosuberyl-CoA/3-oxoadipyl-CoA thiolase
MKQAFIVSGLRTPIGRYGGALSSVRTDDLAALVLKKLLEAHPDLDPAGIDDVVMGCANQAGEDNRNVARMALLLAGLPDTVPGLTMNRLCASGMNAVTYSAAMIHSGMGELFLAGGVEHMTRSPYVMAKPGEPFSRTPKIYDTSLGWRFVNPAMLERYGIDSMGRTAENVAEKYGISREDQDSFALWSQQKTKAAVSCGRLRKEITPVEIRAKRESRTVETDEFPRPDTTLEKLAQLKPAFRKDGKGSVTAGNSSGLNDGAAVLLVASEEALKKFSLKPIARIVSWAASGVDPRYMGMGPVPSSRKALSSSSLTLKAMDLIELNEAFAAQVLASVRELGIEDHDPRLNPNGGAIALGHPLGMSGSRLLLTAAVELHEKRQRYALCTMCVGLGQGMATVIERV